MTYVQLAEKFKNLDKNGLKLCSDEIYFFTITVGDFKELMDEIPNQADLDGQQNDSPTIKEFLGVLTNKDLLELYVVTEVRPDCRVTVEGAVSKSKNRLLKLEDIINSRADERNLDKPPYRLWWD